MLQKCVAVSAGKGGVLKTTLSSHLAALAAERGRRTLLVDCDPQGNTMFDLGFASDGGAMLAAGLSHGRPLRPLRNVRPRLDVVPGGPYLDTATSSLAHLSLSLEHVLVPIANHYDLIVLDSPARELALRRLILTAAAFVVVPSALDRASESGLADLAATINEVRRSSNPHLDVLAVVAAPIPASNTQIRRRALDRLGDMIGDPDLVCTTIVRHSALWAEQCRLRGQLSHEYKGSLVASAVGQQLHPDLRPPSTAGRGVADDWEALVGEILDRFDAELAISTATTR